MKVLLGVLIGILITLSLFWGYRRVISPFYSLSIPEFVTDTTRKRLAQEDIIALKNQTLSLDEKISSTNKRLDDILIFGGIIITLLLAINVTVYVNSERQVEKYFRDNFDAHKQRVLKITSEAEETAGKVKAELEIVQNLRRSATASVQIPT
jgi:hypothetical protein